MFNLNLNPARSRSASWHQIPSGRQDLATDTVNVATESPHSEDGLVVCANLPRSRLFKRLPILERYFHDDIGAVLLPYVVAGIDDDIL
jgi:hypothetical protein